MALEYTCRCCGDVHVGLPAWHFDMPVQALAIPTSDRAMRMQLTADDCVIDQREFYIKALLEVPVIGVDEPFTWGVWLSLSEASHEQYVALFHDEQRASASFFAWLCNTVPGFPETQLLKTMIHIRPYPTRPSVELEPTDHPLAIAQRTGLSRSQAIELAEGLLHPMDGSAHAGPDPS
jgi:hypothetical protein